RLNDNDRAKHELDTFNCAPRSGSAAAAAPPGHPTGRTAAPRVRRPPPSGTALCPARPVLPLLRRPAPYPPLAGAELAAGLCFTTGPARPPRPAREAPLARRHPAASACPLASLPALPRAPPRRRPPCSG